MRRADVRAAIAHEVTRAYDNYKRGVYSLDKALGALSVCNNLAATVLHDATYMQYIVNIMEEVRTLEGQKLPFIHGPE